MTIIFRSFSCFSPNFLSFKWLWSILDLDFSFLTVTWVQDFFSIKISYLECMFNFRTPWHKTHTHTLSSSLPYVVSNFPPQSQSPSPRVSDILTTGYISVHNRSPYFLWCYIYKFNIGTSDIVVSLNILIEILIMIMPYLFKKKNYYRWPTFFEVFLIFFPNCLNFKWLWSILDLHFGFLWVVFICT
jgi:hypothetical protein